jgi:8-oxo-dGTP pyrophosphatase MutT (NUDIX family)
MINARLARVVRVLRDSPDIQELIVDMDGGGESAAVGYPPLTGSVRSGDEVIVNTTAVDLGLGSGGRHFVIWALQRTHQSGRMRGHIMKMRYSPMQACTGSFEEDPANGDAIGAFTGLHGMPVIICELHSMVAPAVCGFAGSVAYIMTDGAALPIAMSRAVRQLKASGLLDVTITAGHAFGGDLEAVNVHSALVAAKAVAQSDAAVVAMGPGIVGTGTRYGFSGIEQGWIADAVNRMGGRPIIVPRLSRLDSRPRHQIVSHHTLTVLSDVCCTPVTCVLASDMEPEFANGARCLLADAAGRSGHCLAYAPGREGLERAVANRLELSTMGRGPDEEPEFFLTCAAAGDYAGTMVRSEKGQGERVVSTSREELVERRQVYGGRIVTLNVDTVVLPSGRLASREVVATRDSVGIAPVTPGGDLVMVRQYRHAGGVELLEIPAGRIDMGESPENAALRELGEETGYKALELAKIAGFYLAVGFATEYMHLYEALVEPGGEPHPDDDEYVQVELVPLSRIPEMLKSGEIEDAKTVAALLHLAWTRGLT